MLGGGEMLCVFWVRVDVVFDVFVCDVGDDGCVVFFLYGGVIVAIVVHVFGCCGVLCGDVCMMCYVNMGVIVFVRECGWCSVRWMLVRGRVCFVWYGEFILNYVGFW